MAQELIYTSAPRGLEPGSSGLCTVAATGGMPDAVRQQLEGLSAYAIVHPHDPSLNPVAYAHWHIRLDGARRHVISRMSYPGPDYAGEPAILAHHLLLDAQDLPDAGPAWLADQKGLFVPRWDLPPQDLPRGKDVPDGNVEPRFCERWKEAAGDAGWAGLLVDRFIIDPGQPSHIIYAPGVDAMELVQEAMALMPPVERWRVTFCTAFTALPPGATCIWRCCLAGTEAANEVLARHSPNTIDLTKRLPSPPETHYVRLARQGAARNGAARSAGTAVASAGVTAAEARSGYHEPDEEESEAAMAPDDLPGDAYFDDPPPLEIPLNVAPAEEVALVSAPEAMPAPSGADAPPKVPPLRETVRGAGAAGDRPAAAVGESGSSSTFAAAGGGATPIIAAPRTPPVIWLAIALTWLALVLLVGVGIWAMKNWRSTSTVPLEEKIAHLERELARQTQIADEWRRRAVALHEMLPASMTAAPDAIDPAQADDVAANRPAGPPRLPLLHEVKPQPRRLPSPSQLRPHHRAVAAPRLGAVSGDAATESTRLLDVGQGARITIDLPIELPDAIPLVVTPGYNELLLAVPSGEAPDAAPAPLLKLRIRDGELWWDAYAAPPNLTSAQLALLDHAIHHAMLALTPPDSEQAKLVQLGVPLTARLRPGQQVDGLPADWEPLAPTVNLLAIPPHWRLADESQEPGMLTLVSSGHAILRMQLAFEAGQAVFHASWGHAAPGELASEHERIKAELEAAAQGPAPAQQVAKIRQAMESARVALAAVTKKMMELADAIDGAEKAGADTTALLARTRELETARQEAQATLAAHESQHEAARTALAEHEAQVARQAVLEGQLADIAALPDIKVWIVAPGSQAVLAMFDLVE